VLSKRKKCVNLVKNLFKRLIKKKIKIKKLRKKERKGSEPVDMVGAASSS